eukprot:s4606_g9.t1
MPVYQRVRDECSQPVVVDEGQVASLLEERHVFRAQKQWEEADSIFRKVVAMGVLIDDKKKVWNLGSAPKEVKPAIPKGQFVCATCNGCFVSRNLLFKHLRAPGPCSLHVEMRGTGGHQCQESQKPSELVNSRNSMTSKTSKANPNEERKHGKHGNHGKHARVARHADADVCLWLGDLPAGWAHPRRVAQLLYRYTPREVEQPWVKKVVKRQYKDRNGRSLGYAILCYRDAEEAAVARKALDGLQVSLTEVLGDASKSCGPGGAALEPSFAIRVRQADHGDSAQAFEEGQLGSEELESSADPSLLEQLRPLPLSELQQRVGTILEDRERLLESAVALLESKPRHTRRVQGVALPSHLSLRLLKELQCLRWPAKNHRPCLTSDRYLVLHSNAKDSYSKLRGLCSELMMWADPTFHYSGVAVTKNFVASPHIDEQDKTFQFAISLGEFSGGELCIEEDSKSVAIIDTRNRIACIDGRFVHWVRNYTGDRYSLIFYDTSDRPGHRTAPIHGPNNLLLL